jgi:hypothetical protein
MLKVAHILLIIVQVLFFTVIVAVLAGEAQSVFPTSGDLLHAGGGGYVFTINHDGKNKIIQGFDAKQGQKIRLAGFGLTSAESVRRLMKEINGDVVIELPGGQKLWIAKTALPDLPEDTFQLELDRSGLVLTFDDEFDTFSWDSENARGVPIQRGTWRTNYHNGLPEARDSRTLVNNGEVEVYSDPGFRGTAERPFGINPFRVVNGVLQIIAEPAPERIRPYIWDRQYTSGLIMSQHSFSQRYGVFEMRARLPKGRGLWPAFWLVPTDRKGPAELDVMEVLGHDTTMLYTTWHSEDSGVHKFESTQTRVPDMAADFHVYGLEWTKDEIKWFFDGLEVARKATPADMHRPMHLLANMTIGGYWPKNPDASTRFPAVYEIDWIRAYRR